MKGIHFFVVCFYSVSVLNISLCVDDCIVQGSSWAIERGYTIPVNDGRHEPTTYIKNLLTEIKLKDHFKDNVKNSDVFYMGPVFDFRYELFTNETINNFPSSKFVLSTRTNKSDTINHVLFEKNNTTITDSLTGRNFFNNKTQSIKRPVYGVLHKYSFVYFNGLDKKNFAIPLNMSLDCAYLHVFSVSCKNCTYTINGTHAISDNDRVPFELNETNVNVSWHLDTFPIYNITANTHINLTLLSNNETVDTFWSFSDIMYITNSSKIFRVSELTSDSDQYLNKHCRFIINDTIWINQNNSQAEFCKKKEGTAPLPLKADLNLIYCLSGIFILFSLFILMPCGLWYYRLTRRKNQLTIIELVPLTKKQRISKNMGLGKNLILADKYWKKQYNSLNQRLKSKTTGDFTDFYLQIDLTQSLNIEATYLLAKNPTLETFQNFAQRIWSESIKNIVFITSIDEDDFLYYWNYVDSTFRTFVLEEKHYEYHVQKTVQFECEKSKRIVNIFHFDSWPNKSQQVFSWTMYKFFKTIENLCEYPILVHGSDLRCIGLVTFCDIVQRSQVKPFEVANDLVINHPQLMLNFTYEDYKLAHFLIYTLNTYKLFPLEVNDLFSIKFKDEANPQNIDKFWHRIDKMFNSLKLLHTYQKFSGDTKNNRYKDAYLYVHSRVKLKSVAYINATYADGYRNYKQFIAAQQPLKNTLLDFWLMILEENDISIIINLTEIPNDENFCKFFPTTPGDIINIGTILITCKTCIKNDFFKTYTVNLKSENVTKDLTIFSLINWFPFDKQRHPENYESIIKVFQIIGRERAVICSDDGISACGLFICYAYVIDMMNTEGVLDVMAATFAIRQSHDKFITKEQLQFLYKCIYCFYSKYSI